MWDDEYASALIITTLNVIAMALYIWNADEDPLRFLTVALLDARCPLVHSVRLLTMLNSPFNVIRQPQPQNAIPVAKEAAQRLSATLLSC